MADPDSIDLEHDSEPTPFLSRGLIGRFLAVGLFVALGTFAVIQSISGSKDDADATHDHEVVASVETSDKPDPFSAVKKPALPSTGFSTAAFPKPTKPKSGFGFSDKKEVIKPNVVTRPNPKPAAGFSLGGSRGAGFAAKPAAKPIANPYLKTTPKPVVNPALLTPVKANPVRVAVTKPPERLAQANLGGFAPKIGSQGFGNVTDSVRRTAASIGDSASTTAQSAASATSKSFGALRSSVGNKAGSLLAASSDAVGAGATAVGGSTKKASEGLANPFGAINKPKPQVSPAAVRRPVQSAPKDTGNLRTFGDRRQPASSNLDKPSSAFADSVRSNTRRSETLRSNPPRSNAGRTASTTTPPKSPFGNASATNSKPKPTLASSRTPVVGGSRSSTQLNARLASSLSSKALNTPGDRRLEGVQAPSLTIEKLSPREIQVNQAADFEIKVRNVGRVVANDVMVVDRVPSGTEFISASPEPTKLDRSGEVLWTIGAIEPGEEKRIRFQLRPTKPGEIGSVAHVLFATRASMRTIVTKPVLDIVHSTRPRVLIGDNVIFDVIVENKGDGPATEVIIQEEIPEQLEYQEGFRQLEYEVGTLMPGQKRKIQLALRASKVGEFRNVVFVSGKGGLEAKHEIDVEVIAPEIKVTSDGPNRRFLQRKATHEFTIENHGTAEANNVDLVARLPGGLRYVSSDNRGRYDSNSHAVYWKMPSLREGVAGTVELTTLPVEVGQQDIQFEAKADLRLSADTTQKMSVEHLVDVYFEIDDVIDPIEVGSDTSYRLRILNQGTKIASNITLLVEFPRGLEPTSVDGDLRNRIQGQRVVFEPVSSLPPGQEVQVTIAARGSAPGDHRVVASIRSDGREVEISKEDTTRVYADR